MSVRTYNPSVRVGNWNEDIQLEEDMLKDFLERKEKGELLIQKTANLKNAVLSPITLSVSRTGNVHFGDTVMLVNPSPCDSRKSCALSINGNMATASPNVNPSTKTALVITSMDGTPKGDALRYNQTFYLCSADGSLFLKSDRATFVKSAKKSRQNPVDFVTEPSQYTQWRILPFNPKFRMELEFCEVPANAKVIVTHVTSNENLCLEKVFTIRSMFGHEYEVTGHTVKDSHKAETDENHWMIVMNVPGDNVMSVEPPKEESS